MDLKNCKKLVVLARLRVHILTNLKQQSLQTTDTISLIVSVSQDSFRTDMSPKSCYNTNPNFIDTTSFEVSQFKRQRESNSVVGCSVFERSAV